MPHHLAEQLTAVPTEEDALGPKGLCLPGRITGSSEAAGLSVLAESTDGLGGTWLATIVVKSPPTQTTRECWPMASLGLAAVIAVAVLFLWIHKTLGEPAN